MRNLVLREQAIAVFSVDKLKEIATCDWVASYVTRSGLVARLCSFRGTGEPWTVGFKYVNGDKSSYNDCMYFKAYNHQTAIEKALYEGNTVLLFDTEREFQRWFVNISCRA